MIELTRNDLQLIRDLAAALAHYRGETCCERLCVEAADILRRAGVLRRKPASEVKIFLGTMLANGPVPQQQIEEQGRQRGFTANQLRTAKEALSICSTRHGGAAGKWFWGWPAAATQPQI